MRQWLPIICVATLGLMSVFTIAAIAPSLWLRQAIFVFLSIALMIFCARVPFSTWLSHRWWLYGLSVFLLVLPLLLGMATRNTARWIELGVFNLQPSQLVIPFVGLSVVTIAVGTGTDWQRLAKLAGLIVAPWLLVFISPDLDTAVVIALALGSVLWFGNFKGKTLYFMTLGVIGAVGLTWLFLLKPYQQERVVQFLQGAQSEASMHYNALQAHIAIGNGGLLGQGWGEGTQASLAFLPERQTDFWFSSFAEQSGLAGVLLLLSMYAILLYWLVKTAANHSGKKEQLYLFIIATNLLVQMFVNIGMNSGLLPISGITLPFASYGGSSLLSLGILLGIAGSAANTSSQHKGAMAWYNLPSRLLQNSKGNL